MSIRDKIKMGRYFGVKNLTKNHKVSEGVNCFKGGRIDINQIMHRYHWDPTDKIRAGCHDTVINIKFLDGKTIMRDITYELMTGNNQEGSNSYCFNSEDSLIETGLGIEVKKVDHYPQWDGNMCVVCEYVFNSEDIEKDKTLWDSTFYWS